MAEPDASDNIDHALNHIRMHCFEVTPFHIYARAQWLLRQLTLPLVGYMVSFDGLCHIQQRNKCLAPLCQSLQRFVA